MSDDRFLDCLAFTWRPDFDGQQLHITPGDRGGATSWGVTLASYASWRLASGISPTAVADLAAATKAELSVLIRARFWNSISCGSLPIGVDLLTYDFGFGSGEGRSVRILQTVLGLFVDGDCGPMTIAAAVKACVQPAGHRYLLSSLSAAHEAFYEQIKGAGGFSQFGNGWTRRNSARLQIALASVDAAVTPSLDTSPTIIAQKAAAAVTTVSALQAIAAEIRHAL